MDSGGNPKNISRIYDVYDNSSYGTVDYAGWLSGAVVLPSQALSKITSPLDGAVLKTAELRIQGIAVAPAGVSRVEVSTDNGISWQEATGTGSWRYDWTVPGDGTYTILSRVIDGADNIETPGVGITITIDSSLPTTSGSLTVDETWSGTVTLTGDVTIPAGITLTVETGTHVRIAALNDDQGGGNDTSRTELIVNGSLDAVGTEIAPINFTSTSSNPTAGDWYGIRFEAADASSELNLEHCTVEYTNTAVDVQISSLTPLVRLHACFIRHAVNDGLYVYATGDAHVDLDVTECEILDTGRYGIYEYVNGSTATMDGRIENCSISNTGNYGIYHQSYYTYNSRSNLKLVNNAVDQASQHGIYIYALYSELSAYVAGNEVNSNAGSGIYCYQNGSYPFYAEIMGNRSYLNNGSGVYCQGLSVPPVMALNTISDNGSHGLYCSLSAVGRIHHNNLYGNYGYELYNAGATAVDARNNYWGPTTAAEMAASGYTANIAEIFDIYDSASSGAVNYTGWLTTEILPAIERMSRMIDPMDGSTLTQGTIALAGWAYALSGVDRVEVSLDNGATWQAASIDTNYIGNSLWHYSSDSLADSTYTLLSRVVDSQAVAESPGHEITVTVDSHSNTLSGSLVDDETWSGRYSAYRRRHRSSRHHPDPFARDDGAHAGPLGRHPWWQQQQ